MQRSNGTEIITIIILLCYTNLALFSCKDGNNVVPTVLIAILMMRSVALLHNHEDFSIPVKSIGNYFQKKWWNGVAQYYYSNEWFPIKKFTEKEISTKKHYYCISMHCACTRNWLILTWAKLSEMNTNVKPASNSSLITRAACFWCQIHLKVS